ncbi:hypothetical protein [Chelativorans sp.]|uniref:hypothetical protein n=1 Tax=Chelativorans sp. TaxID=2203393 RepID=UPI0028125F43|nr:hypothetical protein [Chelativorans sp.]
MSRTLNSVSEELPYRIELWNAEGSEEVERVLARALSAQLARAIFEAARNEHPERRITLAKGGQVLADSRSR